MAHHLIPNTYTMEEKLAWLTHVEGLVKAEVLDLYMDSPVRICRYDEDTDTGTVLLVPSPFEDIYLRWMEAQIHYYNGEMDRYNNAIILYESLLNGFKEQYHRTHRPILGGTTGNRFLF